MILGVPEADRQQIRHWTDEMLHREPGDPKPTQAGMEAGLNSVLYLYELAKEKRRHPTDDMLSGLVATGLSDEEVAAFGVLLAGAGSETVTKLVGGGVVLFERNPGEWAKVLADPAGALPGAVEEILRYWAPSQYQGRRSTKPSEWHGVTIPADEPVLLLTGRGEPGRARVPRPGPVRHRSPAARSPSASATASTPASAPRSPGSRAASRSRRSRSAGPGTSCRTTACAASRWPTSPATATSPSPSPPRLRPVRFWRRLRAV